MEQNLLFFPIKLFSNEWSLFVIVALPCIGKKSSIKPMLCFLDPIGNNGNNADIITMNVKIRQLLNVLWQNKFRSKVDKIENPFSKRSLPLRCFKGMNILITLIKSYLWKFFVNGKFSWHSHVFCFSHFDDQLKGGYLMTIQMQVYVWYFMRQNFPNLPINYSLKQVSTTWSMRWSKIMKISHF